MLKSEFSSTGQIYLARVGHSEKNLRRKLDWVSPFVILNLLWLSNLFGFFLCSSYDSVSSTFTPFFFTSLFASKFGPILYLKDGETSSPKNTLYG
jgi:hypothetical protein